MTQIRLVCQRANALQIAVLPSSNAQPAQRLLGVGLLDTGVVKDPSSAQTPQIIHPWGMPTSLLTGVDLRIQRISWLNVEAYHTATKLGIRTSVKDQHAF